jgi:hypothetical protein
VDGAAVAFGGEVAAGVAVTGGAVGFEAAGGVTAGSTVFAVRGAPES